MLIQFDSFSVDLSARIALCIYFQRTVFLFKFGSLDGHFLMYSSFIENTR